MRAILIIVLTLLLTLGVVAPVIAQGVYVDGYYRKDGTYVQPHYRSAPDSSYNNNWSTYPNINPYTGEQGTRQPRLYDDNTGFGSGQGSLGGYGTQPRSRSRY